MSSNSNMPKPLSCRVIIKQVAQEAKTESGIYIPETAVKKHDVGEVLAIGTGVKSVKKGDRVVYTYSPSVIVGKEEYMIATVDSGHIKEDTIVAIL